MLTLAMKCIIYFSWSYVSILSLSYVQIVTLYMSHVQISVCIIFKMKCRLRHFLCEFHSVLCAVCHELHRFARSMPDVAW